MQKGFAHAFLVVGLVVALIGALGFIFWQNFIYEEPAVGNGKVVTDDRADSGDSEIIDMPAETKAGIRESMGKDGFAGLEAYMTIKVDGAIANSDGIFNDIAPDQLVDNLYSYFNEPDSNRHTWQFAEFEDVTNEDLKRMAEENTYFDFDGTYVAVGESTDPTYSDGFIAYRLNDEGLVTEVFYGLIL